MFYMIHRDIQSLYLSHLEASVEVQLSYAWAIITNSLQDQIRHLPAVGDTEHLQTATALCQRYETAFGGTVEAPTQLHPSQIAQWSDNQSETFSSQAVLG